MFGFGSIKYARADHADRIPFGLKIYDGGKIYEVEFWYYSIFDFWHYDPKNRKFTAPLNLKLHDKYAETVIDVEHKVDYDFTSSPVYFPDVRIDYVSIYRLTIFDHNSYEDFVEEFGRDPTEDDLPTIFERKMFYKQSVAIPFYPVTEKDFPIDDGSCETREDYLDRVRDRLGLIYENYPNEPETREILLKEFYEECEEQNLSDAEIAEIRKWAEA